MVIVRSTSGKFYLGTLKSVEGECCKIQPAYELRSKFDSNMSAICLAEEPNTEYLKVSAYSEYGFIRYSELFACSKMARDEFQSFFSREYSSFANWTQE